MDQPKIARRAFLATGLALFAAPAIVRASSLMPVKAWVPDVFSHLLDMDIFHDAGGFSVAMTKLFDRETVDISQPKETQSVLRGFPPVSRETAWFPTVAATERFISERTLGTMNLQLASAIPSGAVAYKWRSFFPFPLVREKPARQTWRIS